MSSDSPAAETAAQTGDRSVAVSTEEQRSRGGRTST
jgi:hypothetical protein